MMQQVWTYGVREMNKMGDNSPLLVYKPQGERFAYLDKDFCLVIMTVAEKEMLKFGHEKICIDSTHGTNPYDFLLTTLLVVDDFGEKSSCLMMQLHFLRHGEMSWESRKNSYVLGTSIKAGNKAS